MNVCVEELGVCVCVCVCVHAHGHVCVCRRHRQSGVTCEVVTETGSYSLQEFPISCSVSIRGIFSSFSCYKSDCDTNL